MRVLSAILIGFLSFQATAQSLTISGKALDRATHEPLPYATVWIKDKPISTITNLQGEFDFHIPGEFRNEILVISMLGYANFEAPVWSLLNEKDRVIFLDKAATLLDEVVVSVTLTAGEIFSIALERITDNFPMDPFIMDGFYRDIKKVGGTYISLLEAAVKIYDENYNEPRNKEKLRENVKLIEVRQSLGYENRFTSFFEKYNLLENLLLHNDVRYRKIKDDRDFLKAVKREKDSFYNGHEIYVLSYEGDFTLKIFIDKHSFSIIHLDYETTMPGKVVEKRKGMESKFVGLKKSIDFKRYEDKMYLNFITMTSKVNWYDINTKKLKFETELYQQLLINTIYPHSKVRISSKDKMRNYGLQFQDLPYNKQFWDNYNVIKETPIDKKILTDLEKLAPLDKQFEN